jgi:hypothetical protein
MSLEQKAKRTQWPACPVGTERTAHREASRLASFWICEAGGIGSNLVKSGVDRGDLIVLLGRRAEAIKGMVRSASITYARQKDRTNAEASA